MLGAGSVGGNIGQVDIAGGNAGELDLGLFSGLFQALHGYFVIGEIHAVAALELGHQPFHDALVEVVAAQTVVARRGQNFNHAVVNVQDGHVKGAAAQVIDHDFLGLLFVHAVGQGGCGGFVDDALDIQACDFARVLGGLPLGVGEVGGDGDDRLGDRAAQISLGVRLQLLEDHSADLLRGVVLPIDAHPMVGTHLPLDGGNGPVRVGDGLPLCHLAHHTLAGLREGDDGGGCAVALGVGNDDGFAALHHRHAGIGGSQIDTDYFRHNDCLLNYMKIFLNLRFGLFSSKA